MHRLGYAFDDLELLALAVTHRSCCAENAGADPNERLEFLGDAVLGLVVTDHIFAAYPDLPEGELAKVRASVVSAADAGRGGRASSTSARCCASARARPPAAAAQKPSILADALEAVIGAVYLDGGLDAVRPLVLDLLDDRIADQRRRSRRPGLQDPAPGARRPALRAAAGLRGARRGPRPRQALLRHRAASTGEPHGHGRGPVEEAGRAGRGPRRLGAARRRARRGTGTEPVARGAVATRADRRRSSPTPTPSPPRPRGRATQRARAEMPELPEVETIRRELEREVVGKRIKTVEVTGTASIRRHTNKKQFITALEGAKITGVDRKGKYLLLKLDTERPPRHPPAA